MKKRIDYGFTYYRNTVKNPPIYTDTLFFDTKLHSNLYQLTVSYPFNKVRSLRINAGFRNDRYVKLANPAFPDQSLKGKDLVKKYALAHVEFIHDDAITPILNIWNGLRWKLYWDYNAQIGNNVKTSTGDFPFTMNMGFDARYFLPIYRNITWAVRGAGDRHRVLSLEIVVDMAGMTHHQMTPARRAQELAHLSSQTDTTPEGRSIVDWSPGKVSKSSKKISASCRPVENSKPLSPCLTRSARHAP